ncbi:MAG: cupredoxin domain-containing protein [Rhizomicrobium sp.]
MYNIANCNLKLVRRIASGPVLANELRLHLLRRDINMSEPSGMNALKFLVFIGTAALCISSALADDGVIPLSLTNHKFAPGEIHVKANVPNVIALTNTDDTAEEFDATSQKVEKGVASHSSGNIRLRPLSPGRYPFMGEFHSETAQGVVIAE